MKRLIPMSLIQREIAYVIHGRRRCNPISRRDLALGLDISDRSMREHIATLAKYHRLPIGRSAKGYYWRRTAADDAETILLLEKKAFAMLCERSLIRKQMKGRGQRRLEF